MKEKIISNNLRVDPRYARGKKYKKAMSEIVSANVCPFCPKTFKWHTNPILKHDRKWFITKSFNPYKNSEYHFLIIGEKHKEFISDLSMSDWKSVLNLISWALKKFNIDGAGLILRFGNTLKTGATVKHLHYHLIAPKIKNGKALPVYFPIG